MGRRFTSPSALLRGDQGDPGPTGDPGPDNPQGEVSAAQLERAIAGTANAISALETLGLPISDPPTQDELTQVLAKVNELIVALRL